MPHTPEFDPVALLVRLATAGVDFVVVGGVAVVTHGYARYTKDLDVSYATTDANLDALGTALLAIGARLRGVDEEVPFVPDARALRGTSVLTLTTHAGDVDLLLAPPGAPPYDELRAEALVVELGGVEVPVASLAHLRAMKVAAGRPQDLVDVEALDAIARLTRSAGPPEG